MTGSPWWRAMPAVETWVPCGPGPHPVRWADGELSLPAHGDAESEAVLAALGGEKAACLDVAQAWQRHRRDLAMLAVGPRGPDDDVAVSWDEVREFRDHRLGRAGLPPELARLRTGRLEMLTLLALGPAFQQVLSGLVAASFAPRGDQAADVPGHRPALEAALTGRLALAALAWLGIDPDLVDVRLPEHTRDGAHGGWGELELTGSGAGRRLHGALPVAWLAEVWAPGLAVVGHHLVVAVEQAAFPEATVLAVPAPGGTPARLTV
ncbi:MAG TPA: hypothetical protein VGD68_05105, partial [Streptosporangiaceae bacterium]